MAIDMNKPQPIKVGDSYVYSLSSYEPVEATVIVPLIDEEEVQMGTKALLAQAGQDLETVTDEWIAENMQGIKNKEELFKAIREQLKLLNEEYTKEQKSFACMNELIGRLEQSVADEEVEMMFQALRSDYIAQLAQEGMSEQDLLNSLEGGQEIIDGAIRKEASDIAAYDAALDAYAKHIDLKLEDGDMAQILNQPEEQIQEMLNAAREAGVYEKVLANALRAKALNKVLSEMTVTYEYETPEQAAERRASAPKFEA